MSEYIILRGVSFSYPGLSISIFDNLTLSFSEGWTVLSGANGSGKTTLAGIISGSLHPDSGTVSKSGEVVFCPQVFPGLSDDDLCYIYDGSAETGKLRSQLALSDSMIEREQELSGGEKKRLQLLCALARRPQILILDEPTNHLDSQSRSLIISVLKEFDGCGIIITHDRTTAAAISDRTLYIERIVPSPSRIYDIPLPLSEALKEIERRKKDGRSAYDSMAMEISSLSSLSSRLGEKSEGMQKKLSKAGFDVHDHSGKAKIDGARLTGKDRSIENQRQRIISREKHIEDKLKAMEKPLMRKEGLTLKAGGYIPSLSFGPAELSAGDYKLTVPLLSIEPGAHIAITGSNGSGKTLLIKAIVAMIESEGRSGKLLYIPQEYSPEQTLALKQRISAMNNQERSIVLSDIYRLGSDPSFLLEGDVEPSPGELKKLDFVLSRWEGRNIIVMDEPTNHLDILSVGILESMLAKTDRSFTLLLVSHDEMFIKETCSVLWEVRRENGEGRVFPYLDI